MIKFSCSKLIVVIGIKLVAFAFPSSVFSAMVSIDTIYNGSFARDRIYYTE